MNSLGFAVSICLTALAWQAVRLDDRRLCSTACADGRRRHHIASASLALEKKSGSLEFATWPCPTWLRKRSTQFSRSLNR